MKHYDEKPKKELVLLTTSTEDLTEYSLAAQLFLDESLTMHNQRRLMNKIDEALIRGDRESFMELSKQYSNLLN
ncbi:IDEAL domain-containing protein [Bacillus sp. DJP31]|uniref:IDEAL domain-containing protein n=1 Tax=Bacillus sp. DJP31 TaxID=3409789 RepID=UPI003BB548B3